jgi:xanthine dehydrogenase FAD-binding subunit
LTPLWQQYIRPASLVEALQVLNDAPGPACPIAGGTDLILDLRQGRRPPVHTLVDVSGIPELIALELRDAELYIGAAVPHSQIINSLLVHQHAYALAEACDLIGGPQVRNVATLGGNVAHALPAADGAIALLALDAYAMVASLDPMQSTEAYNKTPSVVGALAHQSADALPTDRDAPHSAETLNTSRAADVIVVKVPLLDLYLGPGKTALKTGQLLVGFCLPIAGHGQGSAFTRVMRAQGVALPVLNLAVGLRREQAIIADLRIAIGPAGPVPLRAQAAEAALRGRPPTLESMAASEAALLAETHFRTSPQRATAGYRQHLAGKLLAEAVYKAWERAV